jgi:hypothetical protein
MKCDIRRPIALIVVLSLLSACVPVSEKTPSLTPQLETIAPTETLELVPTYTATVPTLPPTATVMWIPTETPDPNAFSVTTEIDDPGASHEKIITLLFSRWLDHLMSEKVSPYFRIDSYQIKTVFEASFDQPCAQKSGALFQLEVLVDMTTTSTLACTGYSNCSAWAAGGGDIIEPDHITKPFSGAVYKTGNLYTLNVITAAPPC